MISTKIAFGILALLAFIGLIVLTGKAYATTFRLSPSGSKIAMASGVLVLAGFVLSMTVGRSAQALHPLIYTVLNIIAGFGFYIFLGGIVLSIILLIATLAHITVPFFLPLFILIVSVSFGVIGLIQSRFITTVDYTVTLKDAPLSWEGKRAVLVSDTHFGLVNHIKFSDKVVNAILAIDPDLVLHAGDFYDGPAVDTVPITASWTRLAAHIPVFYAPGNHETYGDYGVFVESVRNAGVTVLDNKSTLHDGVQIAGVTYYGTTAADKMAASAIIGDLPLDRTKATILINHPPTSLDAAQAKGVDIMVSGHTHNGQFWPNTYLVRAIYGIYYYGLNDFNSMKVLTTSGVGTFGPPFRLFNTPELVLITFKTK